MHQPKLSLVIGAFSAKCLSSDFFSGFFILALFLFRRLFVESSAFEFLKNSLTDKFALQDAHCFF